jgi:hypothetical protein
MNLIKLSTKLYPYTITELQGDYPNVSFPLGLEGVDLGDFDAAEVITDDPPEYESNTEAIEPQAPQLINGEWRVLWTVRDLTVQEIKARQPKDWIGFNAAILTNHAFNTYYAVALSSVPAAAASLPAAFTQVASQGIDSFALAFTAFCQAAEVTTQHRQEWATLAEDHNLSLDFTQLIRGDF